MKGLGAKQREQIKNTEAKIVAILTVRPFTYGELREVTRIQRNALRTRLNHLLSKKMLFEHKYRISYEERFYGDLYEIGDTYDPPIEGRVYYLINWSNPKTIELVDYHFQKRADKLPEERKSLPQERKSSRKIVLNSPAEVEVLDEYKKRLKQMMNLYKYKINASLLAVLDRIKIDEKIPEDEIIEISKIIDFFLHYSFSLHDILIRCSTYPTLGIHSSHRLSAGCVQYTLLWKIIEDNITKITQRKDFMENKTASYQKFLDHLSLKLGLVRQNGERKKAGPVIDLLKIMDKEFHSVQQILSFPDCQFCIHTNSSNTRVIRERNKQYSNKEIFLYGLSNQISKIAEDIKEVAESLERSYSMVKKWNLTKEDNAKGVKAMKVMGNFYTKIFKLVEEIALCVYLKLKFDYFGVTVPFIEHKIESLYQVENKIMKHIQAMEKELERVKNTLQQEYLVKEIERKDSVDVIRKKEILICAPMKELEYFEGLLKKISKQMDTFPWIKTQHELIEKYEIPRKRQFRRSLREKYSEGAFGSNKYPNEYSGILK